MLVNTSLLVISLNSIQFSLNNKEALLSDKNNTKECGMTKVEEIKKCTYTILCSKDTNCDPNTKCSGSSDCDIQKDCDIEDNCDVHKYCYPAPNINEYCDIPAMCGNGMDIQHYCEVIKNEDLTKICKIELLCQNIMEYDLDDYCGLMNYCSQMLSKLYEITYTQEKIFNWLIDNLKYASEKGMKVILAYHLPHGIVANLEGAKRYWVPQCEQLLVTLLKQYSNSILAILTGHTDTFGFRYSNYDYPLSVPEFKEGKSLMFLALSPYLGSNPGFSKLHYDTQNNKIKTITQYILCPVNTKNNCNCQYISNTNYIYEYSTTTINNCYKKLNDRLNGDFTEEVVENYLNEMINNRDEMRAYAYYRHGIDYSSSIAYLSKIEVDRRYLIETMIYTCSKNARTLKSVSLIDMYIKCVNRLAKNINDYATG